jgi:hypothetical protein
MFAIPIFDKLLGVINTGLEKWIPDANVRAQAAAALAAQANAEVMGQIQLNAAESQSPSLWVAGWRPFIGWVCGAAFAYTYVLQPFLAFGFLVAGVQVDVKQLPVLDWSMLWVVLGGMLGLGTLRTVEKVNGVTR